MIIRCLWLTMALLFVGCAHTNKQIEIEQLTYLAGSREAYMLRFEPTGSSCLDALQINLANAGCSELQAWQSGEDELLYFKCNSPSTGATDMWSNSAFVVIPIGSTQPPDYIRPICIDPQNVLGVLEEA
jgi:hypothetical protein